MKNTADVIIIGGGIHGASLAFHLGQRGLKAIVLEKETLAAGATGRSSGVVRMHYDFEPESRLAWESFHYFRNWADMVGGESGFTRTGFLQIISPEYEDALRGNVAMHQRIGIPSLLITADDVRRLAPHFKTNDFNIAAYEPESGYADPSAAAASLMDAAKQHGARLEQGVTVTGIQLASGKVIGVSTTNGDFSAPIVVNAAGPWAQSVAAMAGVELPVDTWRHDVAFVRQPKTIPETYPLALDSLHSVYFRPETGGLTLIGLEDNNPIGESPDGFTDRAHPGFVERAIDRICIRIPGMEAGELHSDQGGYDGITPDQRAILGQIGPEGFYAQCGFSGTGFKLAPAVGLCMSELIVDGEGKTVDITAFDPTRFERGDLLKGEHDYGDIWH